MYTLILIDLIFSSIQNDDNISIYGIKFKDLQYLSFFNYVYSY